MERKPLVSFIIPVYNVAFEMLDACVKSIFALSLSEHEREIIIVDDGSESSPIASQPEWIDQVVYVRQRNAGVAVARNRALLMATGQFVQFVDGDDLLLQTPYEHVLDLLRYGKADMVMFDHTNAPVATAGYADNGPMAGPELMWQHNIHGAAWGYAFSRNILGELRFTPGVAYGEDEEFTALLVLRAESVYQTTAQAYFYRQHAASATGPTTQQPTRTSVSQFRKVLRRLNDSRDVLLRLHHQGGTLPAADRVALQRRVAQLTMDYIYNVMVMTQSRHFVDRKLQELRKAGLLPLPDRNYTKKYAWFRKMTSSSMGITLLMKMLPLFKRER